MKRRCDMKGGSCLFLWTFKSLPSIWILLLISSWTCQIDAYTYTTWMNENDRIWRRRSLSTSTTAAPYPMSIGSRRRTKLFAYTEPNARTRDYNLTDSRGGHEVNDDNAIYNDAAAVADREFFFSGSTDSDRRETDTSDLRMELPLNGDVPISSSTRVNGSSGTVGDLVREIPVNGINGDTRESRDANTQKQTIDGAIDDEENLLDKSSPTAARVPDGALNDTLSEGRRPLNTSVAKDERQKPIPDNDSEQKHRSSFGSQVMRLLSPAKSFLKRVVGKDSRTKRENHSLDGLSDDKNTMAAPSGRQSLRRLWRRRHARTLEEGIRRERTAARLSLLMNRAQIDISQGQDRSYIERTLMGVINVLAEEIEDLDIDLTTVPNSPIWRKEVEELRINFSRLGFRPIRMGGITAALSVDQVNETNSEEYFIADEDDAAELYSVETADEGFSQIDEDNSGTLDRDELAQALRSISPLETDKNSVEELASNLLLLYDVNGDGVVDRDEYQQMVEDMARLRSEAKISEESEKNIPFAAVTAVKESIQSVSQELSKKAAKVASAARDSLLQDNDPEPVEETERGSIVLSDLNLDLRRLVFGAFPVVKKLTPGGPLILEPFTATVTASFSREDVMGSFLLDAGLRRLVARTLRVRVRSFRDVVDGALFFGRRWKMTSKTAPVVEVLGLSNVEFDASNKMVITGRARIRTGPDAPVVTNTFKVRTKIGTRKNGHVIRLVEPELAFVFECPETLDKLAQSGCRALGLEPPRRPEPIYSFFPIYSPFKVDDNDGFDMGEDNCIRSIDIRNGKLQFEMSVVLRPGRFLGNHYVAFTLPMRTFIITMDRVWEGIRAARENKKIATREKKLKEKAAAEVGMPPAESSLPLSSFKESTPQGRVLQALKNKKPKPISFFSRFVEGYTLLESQGEAKNERLTYEISDWFGRQGETLNTTAGFAPDTNATLKA